MRLGRYVLALGVALVGLGAVSPVFAEMDDNYAFKVGSISKYGKYIWGGPYHDEVRVYLNEAKIPHNSQWADDTWKPQDWIDARGGSAMAVIEGFYASGVVVDQYTEDGVPVLEVGPRFLDLSGQEQRRVAAFIDHVFQITASKPNGMFSLVMEGEEFPFGIYRDMHMIGIFNSGGLQLQ